jgi:hypothetical protein
MPQNAAICALSEPEIQRIAVLRVHMANLRAGRPAMERSRTGDPAGSRRSRGWKVELLESGKAASDAADRVASGGGASVAGLRWWGFGGGASVVGLPVRPASAGAIQADRSGSSRGGCEVEDDPLSEQSGDATPRGESPHARWRTNSPQSVNKPGPSGVSLAASRVPPVWMCGKSEALGRHGKSSLGHFRARSATIDALSTPISRERRPSPAGRKQLQATAWKQVEVRGRARARPEFPQSPKEVPT